MTASASASAGRARPTGQHRSTQRYEPTTAGDEEALRAALRAFAEKRPRWGYRRAHDYLLAEGWQLSRKRVQRLWREEGLRVPRRKRKRPRAGEGAGEQAKLRASRPGEIWVVDFQADQTQDVRALRLVNVIDEFTREALVMHVARSGSADDLVMLLDELVAEHGAPAFLRCEDAAEPLQRRDVALQERLLSLALERHHEPRARVDG